MREPKWEDVNFDAEILSPLFGQKPWNVKLGHGTFLTLEFGLPEDRRSPAAVIHGQWHLWIENCAWRIDCDGKIFVGCEDEREQIHSALAQIQFGELDSGQIDPKSLDLRLGFGSVLLRTFSTSASGEEQWSLYKPDRKVWIAKAGGNLTEVPMDSI